MTVHLVKLCVGVEAVADLSDWQKRRVAEQKRLKMRALPFHDTRMTPKRRDEVLDGGSLYWVVKGVILVRQQIVDLEAMVDAEGRSMCRIWLGPELVRTQAQPKRPFQGWRYLKPEDAPLDVDASGREISAELETALKDALAW